MSLAVIAFALLAIRAEFQVTWLDDYETFLEALFLIGLAGVALTWSTVRWGTARTGRFVFRIGVVIAAIAVPLVAVEFATRYLFRDVRSSADGRSYFAHRDGPSLSINRFGFREREIGPKRPERYRIAVVGDSLTWGQGIEERERFSNLLERYLGPQYEVLNFGRPGNNMPEHLDVLDQALSVSPDFVLLQLYINDFETPQMQRPNPHSVLPWPPLDRWMLASSAVYDIVTDSWSQFQERTGMIESYAHYMERNLKDPASANSREAFGMLRQFIERGRAAGASNGTVLFPNPGLFGKEYPFGYLHDRVREVCAGEHITCLDLRGPFSTFRKPQDMWVSRFDPHPNARANQRAAQEIFATFSKEWHR